MAGKLRFWKEKNGRYWARLSIPAHLRPFFANKTQLTEALGGDRRAAEDKHPAAVARLKDQLRAAQHALTGAAASSDELPPRKDEAPPAPLRELTPQDLESAVWTHYEKMLAQDESKRAGMPSEAEIALALEEATKQIMAGDADPNKSIAGCFNVFTDYELKIGARHFDRDLRTRRLKALRAEFGAGSTRLVDGTVQDFVIGQNLAVRHGTQGWRDLAQRFMRAEIEALERTLELDQAIFDGTPKDPIVRRPAKAVETAQPVSLWGLFERYVEKKQLVGKHQDGGATWALPIRSLIKHVGHDDARRIKHEDLLGWRDALLAAGKSPKTIRDKYLAAARAVLVNAVKERLLPSNEMADVQQETAKKVRSRERGFTTAEAVRILTVSLNYHPAETTHPSHRESAHITSAKRWVPLLCAFTGARVTEVTQLRKQDLLLRDGRWVLRITPEAGSVKTGEFRDVPLHRQVVALGFTDFFSHAKDGPLFHAAKVPEKYLANARVTGGRISEWLHELKLVPKDVQPNYGWRHRFKTQGRELGMSDRVLDAIQGHSGKKAADDYGDVTLVAKAKLIDALPDYDIELTSEHFQVAANGISELL